MADLVPMSQAATTSLVTTLQNTDLFALAREDNTSETGYRSKVARVDAMAKKVVNETDYSQLQTTDKKIIGAINEVNAKASQFNNMTATASGSIATFTDGGDNIPVKAFECEIVAQQASGTPTPTSPLSITGFSEADIGVSGKNLFGGTLINGDLPLNLPPDTYSFSAINLTSDNAYLYVRRSTDGVNFDLVERIIYGTTVTPKTITLESGYIYSLWSNNNYARVGNVQIEKGDTVTTYEPYKGNTYIVEFGQTIYGGRLVYANGEWSIEATHQLVICDGTEDWSEYTTNKFFANNVVGEYENEVTSEGYLTNQYLFQGDGSTSSNGVNTDKRVYMQARYGRVWIYDTSYSTVTDLTTALSNTPLQILYPLETPVIIPITSSTRVKTISGANNIFSNTGDCEVEYFTNKADSLAELIKAFVL